jgi:hypothetical protein
MRLKTGGSSQGTSVIALLGDGMPVPSICSECRRLSELYFQLVEEHSTLLERQHLMCGEERADVDLLVQNGHRQVEIARAEFMEHRRSHA